MGISRTERQRWASAGKDVVVLHQFPRSNVCPNISPFCLKLETYLRMAGIEYVSEFKHFLGPKGKSPWITFNGRDIADSQLDMEHLSTQLDKDLDAHLTPEEAAVARALQVTLDERFIWCIVLDRFRDGSGQHFLSLFEDFFGPKFLHPLMMKAVVRNVRKLAHDAGMGRHTWEELDAIAADDLKALSDFLGEKPYLMGFKPSTVDCSLFGHLCQVIYATDGDDNPLRKAINEDSLKNLRDYVERMKREFWPDWDERLNEGVSDAK